MDRRPSLGINPSESSFFDFDPPSNTGSPYHNQSQYGTPGGIPGWGSDMNFRPLSPPDSASPFSKDWNYGFQNMSNPPSSNIFNTTQSNSSARAHYGQVTPPDDEHDDDFLLEHQLREQEQGSNDVSSNKKRKRGNGSNAKDSNQSPTKRNRKNNARNAASAKLTDSSKPEDVRRSKFLERNRVAASKCRQKKKEWTQNLEDRGRGLQKDNSNLRILVDSLRQEALFLKGEMLRHSGCECPQINDYLKTGPSMLPGGSVETMLKREISPFDKMPESVASTDLDDRSVVDEEVAQQSQTNAEIAGDENALEALLTSSINHDTSDEGVANQVGG